MKQTANEVKQRVEEQVQQTADEVRDRVGEAAGKLRRRASETAEAQRENVATMSNDLGAAIRKAAQELHARGDERTGDWADALAEQLERASHYLRDRDLRRLLDDAQDFARRRPGLVIGGLFVAGIAASRFLKASRPEGDDRDDDADHQSDFEPSQSLYHHDDLDEESAATGGTLTPQQAMSPSTMAASPSTMATPARPIAGDPQIHARSREEGGR